MKKNTTKKIKEQYKSKRRHKNKILKKLATKENVIRFKNSFCSQQNISFLVRKKLIEKNKTKIVRVLQRNVKIISKYY